MATFPKTINFTGFNTPTRFEMDLHDLECDGTIPRDLAGDFFRVHPDPQFPPRLGDDIWFNGDGMVSRFRFRDGRVDFRQRWVHTDKFRLERDAGHGLFGAYRNPLTDDPSVQGRIRGTANTNVLVHAGRLWALKEDSPPIAMDPETMETFGYHDFNGKLTSATFTAHPKIDPETGGMVAFGYAAKGLLTRDVAYYEISASGEIQHEAWFEAPYYCMMHDFGVTRDYVLFHIVPCVSSWERLRQGLPHFGFDTSKEVYLGVLPRGADGTAIRWFRAPNLFGSHVMNAFNDGTKIHFDIPEARNNMFPFFPDISGAPFDPIAAQSRLTRWTVDLASTGDNFDSRQPLTDLVGEFPRIDERAAMAPYRHGFLLVSDTSKPLNLPSGKAGLLMNTLGYVDVTTGRAQQWWVGPTSSLQEPCFIPKSRHAPEGEGYVVALANRLDTMLTDLLLFDAQQIAAGPIATLRLPFRIRPGLHGNWHPASPGQGLERK